MNLLISSEEKRNGIREKICSCKLCKNLAFFLDDSTKEHYAKQLKTWVASFNPTTAEFFGGTNSKKQQDTEEFLSLLIGNCGNSRAQL